MNDWPTCDFASMDLLHGCSLFVRCVVVWWQDNDLYGWMYLYCVVHNCTYFIENFVHKRTLYIIIYSYIHEQQHTMQIFPHSKWCFNHHKYIYQMNVLQLKWNWIAAAISNPPPPPCDGAAVFAQCTYQRCKDDKMCLDSRIKFVLQRTIYVSTSLCGHLSSVNFYTNAN